MKLRINPRDLKYVAAFAIVATIVASGAALRTLNPPLGEQYFAMWIVGSTGYAQNFFPLDSANLAVDEPVAWTLGIQNNMGGLEYTVIEVKLLNSSISGPSSTTCSPSSIQAILNFTRVLVNNETWIMPFDWTIVADSWRNGVLTLTDLSLDGQQFQGQLVSAHSGNNFRFVFELWFYDDASHSLAFSQQTTAGPRCVWTQIWFNATRVL